MLDGPGESGIERQRPLESTRRTFPAVFDADHGAPVIPHVPQAVPHLRTIRRQRCSAIPSIDAQGKCRIGIGTQSGIEQGLIALAQASAQPDGNVPGIPPVGQKGPVAGENRFQSGQREGRIQLQGTTIVDQGGQVAAVAVVRPPVQVRSQGWQ